VAHGEVMKSIDRAIHKVEEMISQAGNEAVMELQANLKYVSRSYSLGCYFTYGIFLCYTMHLSVLFGLSYVNTVKVQRQTGTLLVLVGE